MLTAAYRVATKEIRLSPPYYLMGGGLLSGILPGLGMVIRGGMGKRLMLTAQRRCGMEMMAVEQFHCSGRV